MRRAIGLFLLAGLALAPAACRKEPQGPLKVLVIGSATELRDPARSPLSPADAILLQNSAQGLVRFDASGNIVPGLAERWNVSDDGLSYIFRIANSEWSDGRKITAQQVAHVLKRSIAGSSKNSLKDSLGAVDDVVAMTDRVIEIRLKAPRPNLLALLAQPELAIVRNGVGSGPFKLTASGEKGGVLTLTREVLTPEEELVQRDEVLLGAVDAQQAIRRFAADQVDMVLGGTFVDLPVAQAVKLPRNSLRFDPAMGLFGLMPARTGGLLDDADARRLLSQAIDRGALTAAFRVPGLGPRATLLEPGLDGVSDPVPPPWASAPVEDRRAALSAQARRMFGREGATIRLFLPEGPGADILFSRLSGDWAAIGVTVKRVQAADSADLKLVDWVAPSTSPAWFVRQFRCGVAPVCDAEVDKLLDAARNTLIPQQRYALLAQAAAQLDDDSIFIALTAPVRWSLVGPRVDGFAGNRYARHTLTDLEQQVDRGGS